MYQLSTNVDHIFINTCSNECFFKKANPKLKKCCSRARKWILGLPRDIKKLIYINKYAVDLKQREYEDYTITHTEDDSINADSRETSKRAQLLETIGFKTAEEEEEE